MKWHPIETCPDDEILVGAWVDEGPVLGRNWKQTVAIKSGKEFTLTEAGAYAQDYELSFDPSHWLPIILPPAP